MRMRILIATGIYPPDIGGPAQYALNVEKVWKEWGHQVEVKTFRVERALPSGFRHVFYFFKCIPAAFRADLIFILDTWSAALPAVFLGWLLRKKIIIRTGGDFLWESYVERTGDLVLLREFYQTRTDKFSPKERIIFFLTKRILRDASAIVFSTLWQKEIWAKPYGLSELKTLTVENYYGPKEVSLSPSRKDFIAGTRPLLWKNHARIQQAFDAVSKTNAEVVYDRTTTPFSSFMDKISKSYAVIQVSLGEVSPNLILDAIRHNKPFILTKETGIYERVKECGLFVDPENVGDISAKIEWLADEKNYEAQKKKVEAFSYVHSWEDISREIIEVYKTV